MVSGVTFKNPHANNANRRKKKLVSQGLLVMFIILVIVIVAYFIGLGLKKSAQKQQETLQKSITSLREEINQKLKEPSHTAGMMMATQKTLYDGLSGEELLHILEETTVPRVVLISAEYDKGIRDKTGAYVLSLTGDIETFDGLAAQVDAWKKDPHFSDVRMGEVTPDEQTGRLVFSAILTLAPANEGERPYDRLPENITQESEAQQQTEDVAPAQEGQQAQEGAQNNTPDLPEAQAPAENAPAEG